MVSLTNYQNAVSGFNIGSNEDLQMLSKALEAGYQVGSSKTGGSALRVESLEASLKVLTFNSTHVKFWKKIPKSPAYSTVEEYNTVSSYGGDMSPFTAEGEAPQDSDSSYQRQTALVKFMGTRRQVTHPMTLVHPAHGDVIAQQNNDGILWLLQQIEGFLFTGNSSLAFNGQAQQWDGLDSLVDSTSIIDMAGAALTEPDVEEGANIISENYGWATDLFLGNRAYSDFNKGFYPRERIQLPAPVNGTVGNAVGAVQTSAGLVSLNPDVFIREAPTPRAAATSANAPSTPASIVAGAVTGSTGDHNKDAPSGTSYVNYVVTACNRFGESAPTAVQGAAIAMTGTEKNNGNYIPLTITNPASIGAFVPEYYRIYRSRSQTANAVPASLSSYSLIAQVPAGSQAGGGTTVFNDLNLYLPFTSTAYLGELTPQVLTFRQLLPMMKMDLAVVGPAFQWLIMLYGVPLLFAKKKWLRYINVGKATTSR